MSDVPSSGGGLAKKLAAVMLAVDKVAKRGRNDFHKYDYATESDIVFAVRQKLAEQHIVLIPAVTKFHREPVGEKGSVLTHLEMEFTFMDGETGECITRPWLGAGTDKEDKGAYKAMTGAEKYFILKTFLIPTGDDPEAIDSNGATTRDPQAKTEAARTTASQVEQVRERLQQGKVEGSDLPADVYRVTRVDKKPGTNARGPFTTFKVTFSDGKMASTFSATLGKLAEQLQASKDPCTRLLQPKGNFLNLIELAAAKPNDDDEFGGEPEWMRAAPDDADVPY